MTDQIEEIIKEIAVKHSIAVSRDDPILVLQTINSILLRNSAKAQQIQLDRFKEELEALALRWGNDSKSRAERTLNLSLAASKNAMDQIMREGATMSAAYVQTEITAAITQLSLTLRETRRIGTLNVVASCFTLLAAAVSLWVIIH